MQESLALGDDPNDKDDALGNTPVFYAKNEQVLNMLIKAGGDVNARNHNDATALHYQAGRRRDNIASALLAKGADVNAVDDAGSTPLHFAAIFGNWPVASVLLQRGADKNAKNHRGLAPLHVAVSQAKWSGKEQRFKDAYKAIASLSIGAVVAQIGIGGIVAAGLGLTGVAAGAVALFVPAVIAGVGTAAVGVCVAGGIHTFRGIQRGRVVKLLVEQKAELNAIDNEGNTPLHLMAHGKPFSREAQKAGPFIANYLIKHGADYNLKNNLQQTPFKVAMQYGRLGLMVVLKPKRRDRLKRFKEGLGEKLATFKKKREERRAKWN